MLAPFSIIKVEPDIIANAEHCIMTENKSDIAGMINIFEEYASFVIFPLLTYKTNKHKVSPIKKVSPCKYGWKKVLTIV